MTALVPAPARCARVRDEGVVLHSVAPDVPSVEARVPVGRFEPVRRGSARPLDPERLIAPVREHPRWLGAPRPVGLPVPDVPLNVGVRVFGTGPAGLGDHHAASPRGASACLGGLAESTYAGRAEA
ncbi:hypothetical protein B0I31_101280 [Saccharothrix carnea]|uniref:Uncharacterized protein n=1 Tax=Saccharothrix carnea TaxID=1280637 RepID=A0A2P8IHX0_SACCR|nr:hypothetical protein [Saccharothrix carnea]PSL58065.1 hypothetical protein B0I31_101280 [Saccharothrix carnea]